MAEPFVFHFRRGENSAPEVMYMVDLYCRCGLCRHDQYQRFYHATAFHSFTLAVFNRLVDEAHQKADYECENCGTMVGADHVLKVAVTYGFVDDAGIVRGYLDRESGKRRYQLVARRRLDPQEMPHWEPDPELGTSLDTISEQSVDELLDRPFNAKLAWIDVVDDWLEDPEGGAYARIAPGFWIVVDASEDAANELTAEIEDAQFADGKEHGDLMIVALSESVPEDLATHAQPQSMAGRWQTWLPQHIVEALLEQRIWADAYMSRSAAVETIKRTFDTANLSYSVDVTDADVFFSQITTPGEGVYGRGLSVSSVLRRAVFTGLTPGEAARLTAEEIVGVLLRVWK
ncbi:MAG: hypothetical protein H0U74_14125 [Bradymonadaceae bacterium]|nr:hypothetical protein [Lujinxingiaceae bacterium]